MHSSLMLLCIAWWKRIFYCKIFNYNCTFAAVLSKCFRSSLQGKWRKCQLTHYKKSSAHILRPHSALILLVASFDSWCMGRAWEWGNAAGVCLFYISSIVYKCSELRHLIPVPASSCHALIWFPHLHAVWQGWSEPTEGDTVPLYLLARPWCSRVRWSNSQLPLSNEEPDEALLGTHTSSLQVSYS